MTSPRTARSARSGPTTTAGCSAGRYDAVIVATGTGAHRTLTGELKVKMPFVGGKVERAIVGGLEENAAAQTTLIEAFLGH